MKQISEIYPFYQRFVLLIIGGLLVCSTSQAAHPIDRVPTTTNLQALSQLARQKSLPIILYAAYTDCPYCALLEEEILLPMLKDDSYDEKVIIRKIIIDDDDETINSFSGKASTIEQLTDHYQLELTPTLLFLDPDGNEIAARMVGINTPELYAAYLDNNINQALHQIRK